MPIRDLSFPVFDADNHFYEVEEALTRHLPPEYERTVQYVQVNGRTKIAIKGLISDYIPNPTFNVVAPPGCWEVEFQLKNPHSKKMAKDIVLEPPPKYITSPPAFFAPEPRLELLNEQGIDYAIMWPTLLSVLEERLADDPHATHAVVHAFNQWLYEEWSFNYKNRIFAPPVITLPVVDKAIAELEWVLERGAKVILIRPAPVPDFNGRRRSFALPEFDPFWKLVEDSGVLVGLHSSDDGQQRYQNEWEGTVGEFTPFNRAKTAFAEILRFEHRGIFDTIASIVGHGLITRFPKLKILPVENGSSWVRPLLHTLTDMYERSPHLFDEDPVAAMKRNIWVHPFHEEEPLGLVDMVGADRVVFGSDYPHAEGMVAPITFVDQLTSLPIEDQARIMGGNVLSLLDLEPVKQLSTAR